MIIGIAYTDGKVDPLPELLQVPGRLCSVANDELCDVQVGYALRPAGSVGMSKEGHGRGEVDSFSFVIPVKSLGQVGMLSAGEAFRPPLRNVDARRYSQVVYD